MLPAKRSGKIITPETLVKSCVGHELGGYIRLLRPHGPAICPLDLEADLLSSLTPLFHTPFRSRIHPGPTHLTPPNPGLPPSGTTWTRGPAPSWSPALRSPPKSVFPAWQPVCTQVRLCLLWKSGPTPLPTALQGSHLPRGKNSRSLPCLLLLPLSPSLTLLQPHSPAPGPLHSLCPLQTSLPDLSPPLQLPSYHLQFQIPTSPPR